MQLVSTDDGLAVLKDASGPTTERTRKKIIKIFQEHCLKITADTNLVETNFLDVTLNLKSGKYRPLRKPNNSPSYVHSLFNHPPIIKKQFPIMPFRQLPTSKTPFQPIMQPRRIRKSHTRVWRSHAQEWSKELAKI